MAAFGVGYWKNPRSRGGVSMWWRRRRTDEDFNAETRAHVDLETDRLIAEGLQPEEARIEARRAFGNLTGAQERFYESRRQMWLDYLQPRSSIRGTYPRPESRIQRRRRAHPGARHRGHCCDLHGRERGAAPPPPVSRRRSHHRDLDITRRGLRRLSCRARPASSRITARARERSRAWLASPRRSAI